MNSRKQKRQKEICKFIRLKKGLEKLTYLLNLFLEYKKLYCNRKKLQKILKRYYKTNETIFNDSLIKYYRTSLQGEWNFILNIRLLSKI